MQSVGICAIFKDEASYLLEWIAYHLSVGFDYIVLFDNGSTDGGRERVARSQFAGSVYVIDWPERPGQMSAYRFFCQKFAKLFQWVAFIDIDEFVNPLDHWSVKAALEQVPECSGVLVQWLTFGPSGHLRRPPGLVIENYDLRLSEKHMRCGWVKSILRSSDIVDVREGPHVFEVTGVLRNTHGDVVPPHAWQNPCHEILVLNHYFTKSQEEWNIKTLRGTPIQTEQEKHYHHDQFWEHWTGATERDRRIQRFVPRIKQALSPRQMP